MDILWLKLITGEDLVANAHEEEGWFIIDKPVRVVMTPDGAAMVPAPPFAKSTQLKVRSEHIVYVAEPEDELRNAYNAKFGNGIVVAKSLEIVT